MGKLVTTICILIFTTFTWGYSQEFWDNMDEFEVITKISLTHVDAYQSPQSKYYGIVLYFKTNKTLSFTCIKHSPYAKNTKIIIQNENNMTVIAAPSNTFKAIGENHQHFRVTQYSGGTFSGLWQSERGHWHFFDALDRHVLFMHPHHKSLIGNGSHLVFREPMFQNTKRDPAVGDKAPLSPPPDPCPSQVHEVTLSIAVTVAYVRASGSIEKAANRIAEAVTSLNVWLEMDVRLHVTIQNAIIYTTPGKVSWNVERSDNCENPFQSFFDDWYNVMPQCCGNTAGGILFHDCAEYNSVTRTRVLCGNPALPILTLYYRDPVRTRRTLGWGIGRMTGAPNDSDGILGGITNFEGSGYDRFSKISQEIVCNAIPGLITASCLKPYESI